jgi:hypothetical protein
MICPGRHDSILRTTSTARNGMGQVAKTAGLNRESLYKALGETGNPEFTTVMRVLGALGLKLTAHPAARARTARKRPRGVVRQQRRRFPDDTFLFWDVRPILGCPTWSRRHDLPWPRKPDPPSRHCPCWTRCTEASCSFPHKKMIRSRTFARSRSNIAIGHYLTFEAEYLATEPATTRKIPKFPLRL